MEKDIENVVSVSEKKGREYRLNEDIYPEIKERVKLCWDGNGIEHYRDIKTGKFVSKQEVINYLP